ncbi:MAG TPA: hypothetical protein VFZ22_02535 [Pyrinomonadaceae bacterium]|nr:hypothetical protein [Pyrinomonadaceae bacterium]
MLRTIAISLILLLSVGVMLPFANSAHGIRQTTQVGQRKSKRYRSRAWWRRYRARMRQKRAAEQLARQKALMALPQNIALAEVSAAGGPALPAVPSNGAIVSFQELPPAAAAVSVPAAAQVNTAHVNNVAASAVALPVPAQGNPIAVEPPAVAATASVSAHAPATATRPRVVNAARSVAGPGASKMPGQMNLSVVALSRPNPVFLTAREQKRMLAGVPVNDLRRIVIDKMVASGGWVVNDFVRDVNGNRVFVVTARTPKDALTPEKAWTFYFTEAGGRVYGLTTEAPVEYADRMTVEAERFIESLRDQSEPK